VASSAIRAPWQAVVGVPLLVGAAGLAQYGLLAHFSPAGIASVVCMVLSLTGALLGATGILTAKRLSVEGMRSRDELVHAFESWQRRLPWLLSGQLLSVGAAFTAGSCSMMIWGFVSHDFRFGVIMAMFTAVTLLMIWIAVSSAWQEAAPFSPPPLTVLGRTLGRTEAPLLWQMVDEVASKLGAVRVDHIVLGLLDGFFVTAGAVRVSHAGELSGHTLYLSAPHLSLLDDVQLRGIVAHELSHFSGKDVLYSERFAPIYHGFERRVMSLSEYDYNDWVGKVFLRPGRMVAAYALYRFRASERHWGRLREHEADKRGADLVGADVFGSALTRAVLIQTRLHDLLAATKDSPGQDDIEAALHRSLDAQPPPDLGTERLAHPFDSHPALHARLDAIGVAFDDAFLQRCAQSPLPGRRGSDRIPMWDAMTSLLSADLQGALQRRAT
jgi:Zn-dependent protease with chaperone function